MKNDTERGLLGAWARKERLALGLSVEQVVARLSDRGAAVDPAYIRAIESGSKRPRLDSEIVDALSAVYRSRPVESEPASPDAPDLSALASVVERQQSQIADLIGVVSQQQGQIAELLEAVRLLTRPAALVALSDTLASTLQDDESAALAHGRLGAVPAAEASRPTVLPDAERRGEAP